MHTQNLFVALITGGILLAGPTFAQSPAPTKQPTREGGGRAFLACGPEYNANPAGDPNCTQKTQNLVPSPGQGAHPATAPK